MTTISIPITQALTTRAEVDAARSAGTITKGRLYYLTDEDLLVVGTGTDSVTDLRTDVTTKSEAVAGTGDVWDDVNAYCFSGNDSDGSCRMCIGPTDIVYVGHNGVVYRYFGPDSVCIGSGGAGGVYPHRVTVSEDWVATGSTDHAALSNRDATDSHPQAAITDLLSDQAAQDAEIALRMVNLIDDPDPYVGGDLKVGGASNHVIAFTDVLGAEVGSVGWVDDVYTGVYIAKAPRGEYNEGDGALLCYDGSLTLFGANINFPVLRHADAIGNQVYVSPEGSLYGVAPPAPGWSDTANDSGSYDLGTGTGLGAWVMLSGTQTTVQQDVAAGDRIDITSSVWCVNKTATRSGTIEIGYGIDGASPAGAGDPASIVPAFSGYINDAFFTTTHGGLTAGQTITLWARRTSGSHGQFGVDCIGATDPHELTIYVSGGGSGGGDGTNLGTVTAPTSVTVTSSTGANATIPQAVSGGDAGVLSGADKGKVDQAVISSTGDATDIVKLTQAEYDALSPPDDNTLYLICNP